MATAPFYEAELRRPCSFSRAQCASLLRYVSWVSLGGGLLLYSSGAWPVIGFLGLDVLLIWGAFRLYFHHHDTHYERLVLHDEALEIERLHGKYRQHVRLEPAFLRCWVDDTSRSEALLIAARHQIYEVGRWLGPEQKRQVASGLKAALSARLAALPHR